MTAPKPPCGTRKAVERHRRLRESCETCRLWWNAYMRSQPSGRAWSRALTALSKEFPLVYAGLLDEERAKEGLPPIRAGKRERTGLAPDEVRKLRVRALRRAQRALAKHEKERFAVLLAASTARVRQEDNDRGRADG